MTTTAEPDRFETRGHAAEDEALDYLLYSTGAADDRGASTADRLPAGADDDRAQDPGTAMIVRLGRELGAISGLFFTALVAFVVCTTLFTLGVSTAVLVGGLFVLVAALVVAGGFARVTKSLLAYAGVDLPPTTYPETGGGWRVLQRLRDRQSWRDLLHVAISFVLATFAFSVGISWVAGALGGLTYWFWGRFLPDDGETLIMLMGLPGGFLAEAALQAVLGGILLVSAPAVVHGLVRLQAAVARGLLVDERGELRRRVSQLTESRSAAGEAESHTLRRLERDLHDGPQQRLVRLGMDISSASRRLDTDPDKARELLSEAFQQSQEALSEIRQLSRGIAPPILTEQGLAAAVTALAARNQTPTTVDVGPVTLTDAAQNAAYFTVAEALTNLEKHSGASRASVEIHQVGGVVVIAVTDDGIGGASLSRGHGLSGLADRLAGVDGALTVTSPAGGPTQITATLPVLAR